MVLSLAGLVALGVGGRLLGSHWSDFAGELGALGPWGYVLFGGAWIALASACFPVSVLGMSAGALFGLKVGVGVVACAAFLAALAMFALGRSVLQQRIRAFVSERPRLAAVDRLAGERALRLNILTRLSPLNFGLACYTLAAGRTSLKTYLGGMGASIPSLVFQVWLGTLTVEAGASLRDGNWNATRAALVGSGLFFMGLLGWQITRLVRQALAEEDI